MQTKTIFKQLFSREYRDKMIPNYKLLKSTLSPSYCWLILGIFFRVIYKDLINAPDDISNCQAVLLFCRAQLSDLRPHGT